MKKGTEKTRRNIEKNIFYKTNPSGGISLIVLVITIIVVIILAAAVIISLQNNNPMIEANKARINSDVANMQAIFTNTVGKIMAEKQDVVTIVGGALYNTPTGNKKTVGEATYQILGTDGTAVVEGKIIFGVGEKLGTTYYTGKELPLYSGDTKWYVDKQGLLSVEVDGVSYGEGAKSDNPPVEEGEEIVASDNPMLQSWNSTSTTDFHAEEYRSKITKVKFAVNVKVPNSKIESWDVSQSKDGSVMAWIKDDGNGGYVLTIAGKEKIIANTQSSYLFYNFTKLKEIEGLELLDTNQVIYMVYMFYGCESLVQLDLSNFNTTNVKSMGALFQDCYSLTSLNLKSNFNTSNVTIMTSMFLGCSSLTNLDLSNFNTSKVENMQSMFSGCSSLTNLDLSNFDTSSVTDMMMLFNRCSSLTTLDISNFKFDNVQSLGEMFLGCQNLTTTINIKSNNITSYFKIFENSAVISPAQITVNYTAGSSNIVDNMIATKSSNSNVVKGTLIN